MKYLYSIIVVVVVAINTAEARQKDFGVFIPIQGTHGIDVSRYQDKIDWKQVAGLKYGDDGIGITFAFIKATEGKTLKDCFFDHNWKETKKHKIIRGAYHYYKPNVSSTEQAENFKKNVILQKGDLPPVLDVEELGKFGVQNLKKGLKNWLKIIETHYGIKPIIYTSTNFYKAYLSGDDFKGYHFWIAQYGKTNPRVDRDWLFWQYSDKGIIKNIRSKVALNYHKGTKEELLSLCKK
jgi:lysozyme